MFINFYHINGAYMTLSLNLNLFQGGQERGIS